MINHRNNQFPTLQNLLNSAKEANDISHTLKDKKYKSRYEAGLFKFTTELVKNYDSALCSEEEDLTIHLRTR